jgi:hypothetical protein
VRVLGHAVVDFVVGWAQLLAYVGAFVVGLTVLAFLLAHVH